MKFTVLMSLYIKERPEYLEDCFLSLQRQTLQASEIVLVLDGPVGEKLMQVVERWQTIMPVKLLQLPENVGLGKALNAGLEACSNEWVMRMDTDDICVPSRFELQARYIMNNPSLSLLGGQVIEFVDSIKSGDAVKKVPLSPSEIINFSRLRNPFNHMTIAYKKSDVLAAGGYQHHLWMEDYNLWLRMLANNCVAENLSEVLVYARGGREQLARRGGLKYVESEYKLASLKRRLGVQDYFSSWCTLVVRSLPRVLPEKLLQFVYKEIRAKK